MGERAGNAPLASCVAAIKDFMPDIHTNVEEKHLYESSKTVSSFSGFTIPVNKPVVGANVFTQTAGIHADGDSKHNLYFSDLMPERFDRKRKYALGKTSGKSNITKNLEVLGLTLSDEEVKKVTARIVELGDQKKVVTTQDLPYIISDVLQSHTYEKKVLVKSYVLMQAMGLKPSSTMSIEIDGELFEESSQGIGKFDAFMNALHKIYKSRNVRLPKLVNYAARIAPGTRTYAVAETQITWRDGTEEFTTRGLDTDETVSAIKATEKMLNLIFPREQKSIISKK
jgi:D-citramalate synthase